MITVNSEKDSAIQCEENLNSLSDEYMLEMSDASFRHIEAVLQYLSKIFDSYLSQVNASGEPTMYKTISSLKLKTLMLSELSTKNAVAYASPGILKALLEGLTVQTLFQKGDSIIIDVLPDTTLKIYGEQPRENK